MQDNNENNNVNVENENVRETVNQYVEPMPVNTVEESNVSNKKNNKKIIIMIAIIILVLVIGVLVFFIFNKDEKSNKENNLNSNNSVTDSNSDDKNEGTNNNSSIILTNLKIDEESVEEEIKDKKYYIYRFEDRQDGTGYNYEIYPESNNNPYEGYKQVDTYTCKDNCIFRDSYFVHEDNSIETFNFSNGKIEKLSLNKKYETFDKNLIVEKYSSNNDIFYFAKYKEDNALSSIEDGGLIKLVFENYNLFFGSSVDLLEKGLYMIASPTDGQLSYEIYSDFTNKLVYDKALNDEFFGVSLEMDGSNYKINASIMDGDTIHLILNSKFKKIVEYDEYIDDCVFANDVYYCSMNQMSVDYEESSTISSFDENGQESIIKKYKNVIVINNDLTVLALTTNNNLEVYDVKNNKVLYSFDALTSSQSIFDEVFEGESKYYDEKKGIFYSFVEDEQLSKKDFPNETLNYDSENYVFGYEYTYNVKTGEGKVTKKATFTQQE